MNAPSQVRLSAIYIYPIKACGGIGLEHSELLARGLAFDRRYLLLDRAGTFVSQREVPRLALVRTTIVGDTLLVRAAGAGELALPLELAQGEATPYRVWSSVGSALRHEPGSRWFSELLGDDITLAFMPEHERRQVNPERARPGDIVSFADGYPLLLISEESLKDLNARLDQPLEMRRFRPNLVVSGCEPFAEDRLGPLRIGSATFRAVKRCDRCSVTTVDPETARRGKEPLRTLAQYRLQDGKVWFGMNLIHDGPGRLQLGDEVRWG